MPSFCCVVGCGSRGGRDNVRYFRIPGGVNLYKHKKIHLNVLTSERREMWLKAIRRVDFQDSKIKYARVCSKHFVTGEPANLEDTNHPDWVPSVNMGYDKSGCFSGSSLHKRYQRHVKRLKDAEDRSTSDMVSLKDSTEEVEVDISESMDTNKETQTDITLADLTQSFLNLSSSLSSEKILMKRILSYISLKDDDNNTRYYTGLDSFRVLDILMEMIEPDIILNQNTILSGKDQILLTLVKLRLNLDYRDLAYRFGISPTTAATYFKNCISTMRIQFKDLVRWPERSILKQNIPTCFINSFHENTTVIIDCFEIRIQKASDLLASAETWSNYKHHQTIKYLIGITPQGIICFISEGWGGRVSDKFLTQNSEFLKYLEPGDVVMADRGFLIKEYVQLFHANVKIPAFTRGKSQLDPIELEQTRALAHVRIHIERVIGFIRMKYRIINSVLSISLLKTGQQPIVDEILFVCCALINLCPPIVPL